MNLNEQAQRIHKFNYKWWTNADGNPIQRNRGELLMLAVSELSEALEGIRKNLMDDHLPHRKMEEVEMADAKIRLLDYAGGFGIELLPDEEVDGYVPENKGEALLAICENICSVQKLSEEHDTDWNLSFAIWSIDDYCKFFRLDLDGAMEEKLAYNTVRHDHTHEARAKTEGKKF